MLWILLPLAYADATRVWDDVVIAPDACEWGYGACSMIASGDEVRAIGSVHERWRYHDPGAVQAREHAFNDPESCVGDPGPVCDDLVDHAFPKSPPSS